MTHRLQQLFDFLEADPDDSFTLYSIAFEYLSAQRWEEARDWFLRLRAAHPGYTGLYYHLGKTWIGMNNPQAALDVYQEGIEVAREQKDFHALGELQRARRQLEDEVEAGDWG
jgi:tetratricopeptide (TPR) repeat protein